LNETYVELRQLRYFVEIADQASFTRAAETLSIAQPALTAQMHKLESEFGAPLFIRSKRGIILSEVGRATLEQARTAVHAAEATKRTAQLAADLDGARVNLAYSRVFPIAQLARIVRGFRRERPAMQLDLQEMWSNDQVAAVADGAIDVGFRQLRGRQRRELAERGIVAIKTGEESLSLAVPSTHPLANRRQVSLRDVAGEPFIMPAANLGESIRDRIFEATSAAGFVPNVVQETADVRLSLGLVSAELGVAVVFTGNRDVRIRNVHYLRLVPSPSLSFGVMYRRGFGSRALQPLLERIAREELA
jgi:DNA-binding transcriptional LysR family regulator